MCNLNINKIYLKFIYIISLIIFEYLMNYIKIKNNKIQILYISNNSFNNTNIFKQNESDSLKTIFKNSKSFLDKNLNGILTNDKKNFISLQKPKVSVIIPIYNCQNFINRAIKSVQNQNTFNLEIILINDFSSDNTSDIISQFQKEDPRIKIINNKKNMGILYSRSIGVMSSKGNLIFSLDNDDMFLNNDIISTITKISDEGNFDIVEFKGLLTNYGQNTTKEIKIRNIFFSNHKLNQVIFQPELSYFPIKIGKKFGSLRLNSVYLWNKCIKSDIYKKALSKLGKDKYSRFMLAHEDVIAMFIIFNTALSYKFVGKYGILHISRKGSAFSSTNENDKSLKELYLVDIIITFPKNISFHQTLISHILYRVLGLKNLKTLIKNNQTFKNLLFSVLDIYFKSVYISNQYKSKIIQKGKILKFLNYSYFKI